MVRHIKDPQELPATDGFFLPGPSWASVANRPDQPYSYTNNFPYDPKAGNTPSSDATFWSAMSLITLLAGLPRHSSLSANSTISVGKARRRHVRPILAPGSPTKSQRATIKYFVIVAFLFLAQALVGGATVHYRADPTGFFGLDLSPFFPSNIFRTWHLQLAIFWIATAYVAGGLFLASPLGGKEPKGQVKGINISLSRAADSRGGEPSGRDARGLWGAR